MKTLIIILIIIAFLQTTVLPIDLILIILICRSYIRINKSNLYLALVFGLMVSHLSLTTLGIDSLVYILAVELTHLLSKTRLAGNSLLIIPVSLLLILGSHLLSSIFLHLSIYNFPKVLIESLVSLPVFYMLRVWEERFIVRKDIKLRVN